MIAALYVEKGGAYYGLPGVEPWDVERDARTYAGPWPVVAHPPCERWGRFWYGGPMLHKKGMRKQKGDDGGCFAAALAAVRAYGGVIEHPRDSAAWVHFGLERPDTRGGWIETGGGWTCCVWQGHYGHKAYKPTWLFYVGPKPPELCWGKPEGEFVPVSGRSFRDKKHREKELAAGWVYKPRLPTKERAKTPVPFRTLLLELAQNSRPSVLGALW